MPTATIAASPNTHQARAQALPPPLPAAIPDWLTMQRAILRDAPDNDTAIRWQLAGALEHITDLEDQLASLDAQLKEARQPAPARRPTQWRPLIRTLLQERGAPMTAPAITQALDAPRSLADTCRDMATAGLLVRDNGHYTLPPDPAGTATNGTAPRRGGRSKKAA